MARWSLLILAGIAGLGVLPFIESSMNWRSRDISQDCTNQFKPGTPLDVRLYLAKKRPHDKSPSLLSYDPVWSMKNVTYRKKKATANTTLTLRLPDDIPANKTTYFLRMVIRSSECVSNCPKIEENYRLFKWAHPKGRIARNLLKDADKGPARTPFPYHYKTVRFDLLYIESPANRGATSPFVERHLYWKERERAFLPLPRADSFFDIESQQVPLNLTKPNFTIGFEFNMRGTFIFSLKLYFDMAFGMHEFAQESWEDIKSVFINANPILLWTTMIAFVLHSIFELLAFERDLQFWRRKKSLVGVSMRTLLIQLCAQLVFFANMFASEKSFPIYVIGMEFLVIAKEVWKLAKLIKFTRKWPFVETRDEYKGETDDADARGMTVLLWVLLPLVIAYAVYQLIYSKHVSYWSYLVHCTAGAFYAFDFLLMLPQLYVNYRLKTVAGMSRSALAYKFMNTIIDDLYTFLTDLPLMYKISCFRDDVVFVIWAFQCCIYPVDPTRPNEYSLVQGTEEEEESAKEETPPAKLKTE
jgi:hypothetical protein